MIMKTHSAQTLERSTSSKFFHFAYLFLWIITGVIFFVTLGHENFLFPILIFAWLLFGIGWFTAVRWKWKALVLAPILTVLAGCGLSDLYNRYDEWQAKQALHKFILITIDGKVSSEFSVGNEKDSDGIWSRDVWAEMQNSVSQNYVIEYRDNFFGAHEWIVRFANGSSYFLSFHQTSLRQWDVSIEHSR
jgi:hypothetical protein